MEMDKIKEFVKGIDVKKVHTEFHINKKNNYQKFNEAFNIMLIH